MQEGKISSKEYVIGIKPVEEALKQGVLFEKVFVIKGGGNRDLGAVVEQVRKTGAPISYVPKVKLDNLSKKVHQGIVALKAIVSYKKAEDLVEYYNSIDKKGLLIALDRISDVRNVGAISRSALCFGADAIVLPQQDAAQINAEAIKSSAGALASIPVCRENSLLATLENLQGKGYQVIVASEKAEQTLDEIDLTESTVLVMGNENKGVDPKIITAADYQFKIEMNTSFDSLNVSVATGIALHEIAKQRR